jgi:hypothetical protein
MRSKFSDSAAAKIVQLVGEGQTLADASENAGLSPKTAYNWASEGRRDPEGRCGGFVRSLDAARTQARLADEEDDGYEPGPVEREVIILIAGRELDQHGRIAAATARALARQVDTLAASRTGSAALGLAAVTRRLDDVIVSLRVQPRDALSKLLDERRARLAALGNGVVTADAA